MKAKLQLMRRALATLVAATRVRWQQKRAGTHLRNTMLQAETGFPGQTRRRGGSISEAICDRRATKSGGKRRAGCGVAICKIRSLHNLREQNGSSDTVLLANVAEGTHDGNITKAVDAVITERFLLAKIGSASDRVAVAGAVDTPIGVITDEAAAIGDLVNVALLGARPSTVRMVTSGAISQGALLEPAASGRVQTLGVGAGTHHVIGRALDAASAAGDVIEVDPFYFLRVI
jgi:hypothetical protein